MPTDRLPRGFLGRLLALLVAVMAVCGWTASGLAAGRRLDSKAAPTSLKNRAGGKLAVDVLWFRPTQMEVGKAAAQRLVDGWKKEARHKGLSFKEYARRVLVPRFESEDLPVVIDPSGWVRNTDGHHRITALREVLKETGVIIPVGTRILCDYRGQSEQQFAEHFVKTLKKGQFTSAMKGLSAVEKMRGLPATYEQLRDNPLRSALGEAFERTKLDKVDFKDYVEFKLGERLMDKGLMKDLRRKGMVPRGVQEVPNKLVFDERFQKLLARKIDKKSTRKFLLKQAADGEDRKRLQKILD